MIRAAAIFFFCVGIIPSAFAQLTISQFIQSTERDAEQKAFISQLEYLASKPYRLPVIQKLEFRTRTNELDVNRQDYAIRVNPANPWEVRNNNRYFREYAKELGFEKELLFRDALIERYTLIAEYLYFLELKRLRLEDKTLTDAQVGILERQQGSSFFDAKDYLGVKVDQMTNDVELEEAQFEIDNQAKRIGVRFAGAEDIKLQWENERVITMQKLERVVDSLMKADAPSTEVAYQEQRIRVAMQEYKLEKSNISVGYIQTQLRPYRLDQFREPWDIALGVTIPIFNPNKGDMAKRKLDVIESQHELEEEKSERSVKTVYYFNKIKGEMIRYNEIEKKIHDFNTGALANTLKNVDSGNPILIVEFNSNLIKMKVLQAKLRQSIMFTYIEFLAYTDRLQKRPLVNYLSEGLEEIKP
jgi:hypothetical protein